MVLFKIAILAMVFIGALFSAPTKQEIASMKKIVGYFPNWGVYGGHRKYFASKIPYDKLTHVQVAFAKINPVTFEVVSPDVWADFGNTYGESWNSKYKGNYG